MSANLPSYEELVCALCDVLDGTPQHHIHDMTGLPEDRCVEISMIRQKVLEIWLNAGQIVPYTAHK